METLLSLDRNQLKDKLFQSGDTWIPFILRLLLGIVIFPHGAQKMLGWYGGYGFDGTMQFFAETVGLPWLLAAGVIFLEFFGSLALIAGFGVRILALSFTALALGIVFSSHLEHGFFMNWYGSQNGEGVEYFLLWIGISVALLISGSGKFGLDQLVAKK